MLAPEIRLTLDKRIHNQRERLKWWDKLFNDHVQAHILRKKPRYFQKCLEQGREIRELKARIAELEAE